MSDAALTVIFKSSTMTADVDLCDPVVQAYVGNSKPFTIDFDASVFHAEKVGVLHPETVLLVKQIFPDYNDGFDSSSINRQGSGFRHILGRIDLTLKMQDQYPSISIHWLHPEACLHPTAQCNLGDVAMYLAKRSRK